MTRGKPIPTSARRLVEDRSGGVCESCGRRPATDLHHRKYRSRGGGNEIQNLIALCGSEGGLPGGNHSGCHGIAHSAEGHELGLSVNSWADPASVPVLWRGQSSWLTREGRVEPNT